MYPFCIVYYRFATVFVFCLFFPESRMAAGLLLYVFGTQLASFSFQIEHLFLSKVGFLRRRSNRYLGYVNIVGSKCSKRWTTNFLCKKYARCNPSKRSVRRKQIMSLRYQTLPFKSQGWRRPSASDFPYKLRRLHAWREGHTQTKTKEKRKEACLQALRERSSAFCKKTARLLRQ